MKRFSELGQLMLEILGRFPESTKGKIIQVCGPISTGGLNSRKKNLLVFETAIRKLRRGGMPVLDQTPLEEEIARLVAEWKQIVGNKGYCWPVLTDIYLPIFESGLVGTLMFLPGWESSVGTCWERSQGLSRGMNVQNYPAVLYEETLSQHGLACPE